MLRHSREEQQMCRKVAGTSIGMVCPQHDGRCVICDLQFDTILPTMREVHVCDDCGFSSGAEQRCIMCNVNRATEPAYYCPYCVALEKDRDGCPRVMNSSRHLRLAAMRSSTTNNNNAPGGYGGTA